MKIGIVRSFSRKTSFLRLCCLGYTCQCDIYHQRWLWGWDLTLTRCELKTLRGGGYHCFQSYWQYTQKRKQCDGPTMPWALVEEDLLGQPFWGLHPEERWANWLLIISLMIMSFQMSTVHLGRKTSSLAALLLGISAGRPFAFWPSELNLWANSLLGENHHLSAAIVINRRTRVKLQDELAFTLW